MTARGGIFDECEDEELATRRSHIWHSRSSLASPITKDERRQVPPTVEAAASVNELKAGEEDVDPLDAFMRQIDGQVAALDRGNARSSSSSCNVVEDDRRQAPPKAIRQDLEAEEEEEEDEWQTTADATSDDYSHQQAGSEQFAIEYEVEYDSNGQARRVKRQIEPLAPVDHSGLEYGAFKKCFFDLPQELRGLSREEIDALRREIDVTVSDSSAPPPCSDFQQLKFGEKIENIIKKLDYKCPTPIQAQSLPILLSGMNLIGIAETGSGKTAAYVWPMIIHIKRSELATPKSSPRALILAPTRELSLQIVNSICKLSGHSISTLCAYGGGSLWQQQQAANAKIEAVVATPGRLIDLVNKKSLSLTNITYFVLDEADKMFSMGFEPQVRSIAKSIRPDRHTVLFSATSNNRLQKLSKDIMSGRVVKIVQGDIGHINDNIQQHLFFVNGVKQKLNWLLSTLVGLSSTGQFTLVFVNQKAHAESVNSHLRNNSLSSDVIHGDLGQHSRNAVIKEFRDKKISIMVATDVASRGLDIPHITTIINFDLPAKFETFVHRLGRTARAGNTGIGYTLVNSKDNPDIVAQIVKSIQNNPTETRIEIPQEILAIASKSKHSDNKNSKSKTKSVGLGYVYKECAINPSEVVCGKASVQQSSHAKSLKNSLQNSFKSNFVAADKNIQMETLNAGKNKSRWDN